MDLFFLLLAGGLWVLMAAMAWGLNKLQPGSGERQ